VRSAARHARYRMTASTSGRSPSYWGSEPWPALYVKGGFGPEFGRFRPSRIVTHAVIDYAKQQRLLRFEFSRRRGFMEARGVCKRRLLQAFTLEAAGLGEWALFAVGGRSQSGYLVGGGPNLVGLAEPPPSAYTEKTTYARSDPTCVKP
jgi:hypothetical protein